jgi:putative transposase
VIDPQSVRTADTVPKASRGWIWPRKVNGRKRLIAVDVTCLLLAAIGRARVRQRLLLAAGE